MSATLADLLVNVHTALKTQLATVSGIPDLQYWATENEDFEKPKVGELIAGAAPIWLRETFAPQPNKQASLGMSGYLVRQPGSWMLQVFVPKGTGKQFVEALAGRICAAFAPGSVCSANGQLVIIRTSNAPQGSNSDDWYLQPVTITWRADNTA